MGSLASELSAIAEGQSDRPRVYADANVPAGVVRFMRTRLMWDVLSVMEHADLRRAPDEEHFRRARDMRRTLISLDRDYLDDRRYPPSETAGVLVVSAPDETRLTKLLTRLDRRVFRPGSTPAGMPAPLPLRGRKLEAGPDWPGRPRVGTAS
ncbi:MAG: DUF5615 family PIN-like protein [Acidobacteriota bacterium]